MLGSRGQWRKQISQPIFTEPAPPPHTHSMSEEIEAKTWGTTELEWGGLDLPRDLQCLVPQFQNLRSRWGRVAPGPHSQKELMRAVEGSVPAPTSPLLYLPLPCPQATVLCDLLLLHILPKRHYYKQKKFKYAEQMGPGAVRELLEFATF